MTKKNESGQALIELIIFLPIMFTLYAMISGFANAINGSINQQKVTRGYFYYRLNNNSTFPKPDGREVHTSWGNFGMYVFGWADTLTNEVPVLACYKISIPLKAADGDKCESAYSEPTTQFIRVGTVYGLCGATYASRGNLAAPLPDLEGASFEQVIDESSCLITSP